MNKYFYILVFSLFIAACSSDDEEVVTVSPSLWEQSHLQLLSLNGPVKQVVEKVRDSSGDDGEEYEFTRSETQFDNTGRITYYNPTGIEPESQARWVGVASTYYYYQYDSAGRLVTVKVYEVGEEPRLYTLTYGEHDCYVPLIFPLGPFDFFLVKGLIKIASDDGKINYTFEGSRASYSTQSFSGAKEFVYEYESGKIYPVRCVETTTRNGEVLSLKKANYTFSTDGALESIDTQITEEEEEVEHSVISYVANKFQRVRSVTKEMLGETFVWQYTYDSHYLLMGIVYTVSDNENSEEESYSYASFDSRNNWVESTEKLNSIVNMEHPNGTLKVHRMISYY